MSVNRRLRIAGLGAVTASEDIFGGLSDREGVLDGDLRRRRLRLFQGA